MPIDSHHPEYENFIDRWKRCRDACAGEDDIKKGGIKYLPQLPGSDDKAYKNYKQYAVYYNFSGRTRNIAIGQVFRKNPSIDGIEIDEIVDNSGRNIVQLSRHVFEEILTINYAGILIDYSQEREAPFLKIFTAESVINWGLSIVNGIETLSFVVIEGQRAKNGSDRYKPEYEKRWLELYLGSSDDGSLNNIYRRREWVKTNDSDNPYKIIDGSDRQVIINGQLSQFIPFYQITAAGISNTRSNSRLLDLVNTNIAHYRNSADHENSLHKASSKTVIARGWPKDDIFPLNGLAVFSNTDGGADFMEASVDSEVGAEMQKKQERMAAMSSNLLSGRGRYTSSAQTSQLQSEGEYATLADIANMISAAMSELLTFYNTWRQRDPVNISYNTDFEVTDIPQNRLTELSNALTSNKISWETYFYNLFKFEMYPPGMTIEEEKRLIDQKQAADAAAMKRRITDEMFGQEEPNEPENLDAD